MPTAISRFIPRPRLHEVDRVAVAADPAKTWALVRATDLYSSRLARTLFQARVVPERIGAWVRGADAPPSSSSARLDDIVADGSAFRLLADVPGSEFVAGAIGKFWEPTIEFADMVPETFARFGEPGFGKVAWSLQVHPRKQGGSWVGIDVRVDATDDAGWHHFLRYWALIGRFSRLIRRMFLRDVVRRLGPAVPDEERELPGDEFVPVARAKKTHAITIEAPPECVWPWLVQMGCRRAGWYSLDNLDNGGVASADRIIPELQHIAVGDVLPATPKGEGGFSVLRVDPGRVLVLGSPNLLPENASQASQEPWGMLGAKYSSSWAFVLEPIGDVATRLLVRVRADFQPSLRMDVTRPAILLVHSLMERAQIRNLKERAEALARGDSARSPRVPHDAVAP